MSMMPISSSVLPWRRGSGDPVLTPPARVAGLWSAFAGVVVTISLKAIPGLDFAYRRPPLRAALETTEALVALLVAYLVFARLGRTRKLDDLMLAVALGTLTAGNLIFGALPPLVASGHGEGPLGSAGVAVRLTGAVLLAVAALTPRRSLPARLHARVGGVAVAAVTVFVVSVATTVVDPDPALPDVPTGHAVAAQPLPLFTHGYAFAVQLIAVIACTVAAVGFARSADRRRDDDLLPWLGAAAVFGTYAALSYAISPALFYTDWVYPADVLLLLFYLMLLVGAAREINGYWRGSVRAATLDERRRLARDLHDGLAQELAYISRIAKQLRHDGADDDLVADLEAAAQRGVRESRQVIAALGTPAAPLEAILESVVHDAAARHGVVVDLELARGGVRLDPAREQALLRITGEAVTNAARHSGEPTVRVVLDWPRGRPRLQVIDRGIGFDPDAPDPERNGFGLTSMRERAAAAGARFDVRAAPGSGTLIEVTF